MKFTLKGKIILLILWMIMIFWLSARPGDFYPVESTGVASVVAHIFLYTILALMMISSFAQGRRTWRDELIMFIVVILSAAYGATDEFHQSFVPGRMATISDWATDIFGIVIGVGVYWQAILRRKPKLLVQICCIGCGAHVIQELKEQFRPCLYFYNPNIFPADEYERRYKEAKRIADKLGLPLIIGDYNHKNWLKIIIGREKDKERGERCLICYRDRLEKTAQAAARFGFAYFTTTLTVSPHKDAKAISVIGNEMANKYRLKYLDKDFKKHDGFKKACALSRELDLYRQEYCGCEFSLRDSLEFKNKRGQE